MRPNTVNSHDAFHFSKHLRTTSWDMHHNPKFEVSKPRPQHEPPNRPRLLKKGPLMMETLDPLIKDYTTPMSISCSMFFSMIFHPPNTYRCNSPMYPQKQPKPSTLNPLNLWKVPQHKLRYVLRIQPRHYPHCPRLGSDTRN